MNKEKTIVFFLNFFFFLKFIAINGNPKGGNFDSMRCHGIFFFNFIAINGNPEDDHFDSMGYHRFFFLICLIYFIIVYGKLQNQ